MRETFKSGSVGGAPGNRCFYPEADAGIAGCENSHAMAGATDAQSVGPATMPCAIILARCVT